MRAPYDRILVDLKTDQLCVSHVCKSSSKSFFRLRFDETFLDDDSWFNATALLLKRELNPSGCAMTLIIPNRFLLFKIVKTPAVRSNHVKELIRYEVEESFPHEEGELIWCYRELIRDEVECQYVVGAMRRSLFASLLADFEDPFFNDGVEAIPSIFVSLSHASPVDFVSSDRGIQQLIAIQQNHYLSVSYGLSGGVVRSKTLGDAFSKVQPSGTADWVDAVKHEIRRTQVSIKRQLKTSEVGGVALMCDVALPETFSDFLSSEFDLKEKTAIDFIPVSNELNHESSTYEWLNDCGLLYLGSVAPQPTSTRRWMLYLTPFLMALTPYGWVWGNFRVISSYKHEIAQLNQLTEYNRSETEAIETLRESLMRSLQIIEGQNTQRLRQVSLLALFRDLQTALVSVGDTWFESLDLQINEGVEDVCILHLTGRFLVRQENLRDEVRQETIDDAELSLQQLQTAILNSPLIRKIDRFQVDYGGIDRGINVVSFEMSLGLGGPFLSPSMKEVGNAH